MSKGLDYLLCINQTKRMAGVPGFEPGHDGIKIRCLTAWLYPNKLVEGDGFEPPNPKERIYSPPRLATSLPLRINGAGYRNRTHDLLITSQLLYLLS